MSCELERSAWIKADEELLSAVTKSSEADDAVAELETQLDLARAVAVEAEAAKQDAAVAADDAYSDYIACVMDPNAVEPRR